MKRVLLVMALLSAGPAMHAQGCSQCRDSVEQTPQSVQKAYRQAIILMAGGAATLFAGAIFLARKFR